MEENNKTVSGSETEEQAGLPNGEPTVEQKKTLKFKIHKFLTDHANIFQIVTRCNTVCWICTETLRSIGLYSTMLPARTALSDLPAL